MAPRMCIAVLFAALFVVGVTAQLDCTMATTMLMPCLTYVTSPSTTPDPACCNAISSVNVQSPSCLCQVIAQLDANPTVNASKAYAMPRDCGVSVDTATCPAFAAPPLPFMPPPLPSSMPPLPTSMPPGLSLPPGLAAPPMDFTMPPGMPPMSIPPGLSAPPLPIASPPSAPTVPPTSEPVVPPPAPTPPAEGPVAGPGASPVGGGSSPAPTPVVAGASTIRASMAVAAALTGAVALVL